MAVLLLIAAAAAACGDESAAPSAPARSPELAATLEHDTGVAWSVEKNADLGTPSFLEPRGATKAILGADEAPSAGALRFLETYSKQIGVVSARKELTMDREGTDVLGLRYAAFTQRSPGGVPVADAAFAVHFDASGAIAFASGYVIPNLDKVDARPVLDEGDAAAAARAAIARDAQVDAVAVKLTMRLVVHATTATDAKLAWEATSSAPVEIRLTLDARSAAVIARDALGADLRATGKAPSSYLTGDYRVSDVRAFDAESAAAGRFVLRSAGEGRTTIEILDGTGGSQRGGDRCNRRFDETKVVPMTSASLDDWDSSETLVRRFTKGGGDRLFDGTILGPQPYVGDGRGMGPAAVSAFAYVDDFFFTSFGRRSWDGAGAPIRIALHEPISDDNASWYSQRRLFSLGDGTRPEGAANVPVGSLVDVAAHEFTHAVVSSTVALVYRGQSGALNESLSDVFAGLLDAWQAPAASRRALGRRLALPYVIGEDWFGDGGPVVRRLDRPKIAHMSQYDKAGETCEEGFGNTYWNASIPSYAFKLITSGGLGCTEDAVEDCDEKLPRIEIKPERALDFTTAGKIYYAVLEGRAIPPRAQFADLARSMVAMTSRAVPAARAADARATVGCAWVAVGVLSAEEVKRNWDLTCPSGAAKAPREDCESTAALACDRFGPRVVCSWNGDGSCCRQPFTATSVCYSDADCSNGEVCARATNELTSDAAFGCIRPNDKPCIDRGDGGGGS